MLKKVLVFFIFINFSSFSFDIEDYHTTYRATRDAYLAAANEFELTNHAFHDTLGLFKSGCYNFVHEDKLYKQGIYDGSCNEYIAGVKISCDGIGSATRTLPYYLDDLISHMTPNTNLDDFISRMEEWTSTYLVESRSNVMAFRASIPLDSTTVVKNYDCSSTCEYLDNATPAQISDLMDTLNQRYNSMIHAYHMLFDRIPPYKAAKAAYQAVSQVYTEEINCMDEIELIRTDYMHPYKP